MLSAKAAYLIPSKARDLTRMSGDTVRFVYILASHSRVLYTGVTRDLRRRMYQHKHGLIPGFTNEVGCSARASPFFPLLQSFTFPP